MKIKIFFEFPRQNNITNNIRMEIEGWKESYRGTYNKHVNPSFDIWSALHPQIFAHGIAIWGTHKMKDTQIYRNNSLDFTLFMRKLKNANKV